MIEHFEYKLKVPFTINVNGAEKTCTSLKMSSPSKAKKEPILQLTQAIARAIMSQAAKSTGVKPDASSSEDTGVMDAKAALLLLYSSDQNIVDIHSTFKQLMLSGVAIMQTENIPMSGTNHYDKLSIPDIHGILGEYIANFIISLVMPGS